MPNIIFTPLGVTIAAAPNTKILAAANRNKISLRFGCAACRCGTCGIAVTGDLTPMKDDERALLKRMELPTDGSVRLACQARVLLEDVTVDLDFQNTYSPDQGDDGI